MIDQTLIDKIQHVLDESKDGYSAPYFDCKDIQELLDSYKSVIEDNAELHKEIAKLRTENNELYEESAKDKGL